MSTKPAKIVGVLSIVAGVVMVIAGAFTWAMVSSQLAEEKIVVPKDAPFLAGATVSDPFSAYAQAETIKMHALRISDGKTYAELGALATKAKDAGDTELAKKYTDQRTTVMNGSFLRASLFTSVLAYGVSALVMGLGLLLGLIGWALTALGRTTKPAVVHTAEAAGA